MSMMNGPMQRPAGEHMSSSHRRDLVWRRLLRMFRQFLKKDALTMEAYATIRKEPITQQGLLFCQALEVPESISQFQRNQCAMLLMVSSHRIIWRKRLIQSCVALMRPHQKDIWPIYLRIFNEASHKQRVQFFEEPLIQVLWNQFRTRGAEAFTSYLHLI